ncbi:MAG TPA: class I SAM-dependent methyltransferase [Clostridiales bacterium]|nr:class I SAM-dependent methyltransferase [Clostridiales bacterium]
MSNECKICGSTTLRIETRIRKRASLRSYRRCPACEYIFLDDAFRLSPEDEFNEYERHQNSIEDPRYVAFFEGFIKDAIISHTSKKEMRCLDFGSGPSPVLAQLLERKFGWTVDLYDKFYASSEIYRGNTYDLITATEVVEHLNDPMHYFRLFKDLLKPNGILSIMTLFHPKCDAEFMKWYYPRDPSHISFYTPKTMEVIAAHLGFQILFCDDLRYITLSRTDDQIK